MIAAICRPETSSLISAAATRGQARPDACEIGGGARLLQIVAEHDRALAAQMQQIARGQRPDHETAFVGDPEMTHPEPVHARHREITEIIRRDRCERPGRQRRSRPGERAGAVFRQGAQHVALGDDAGLRRPRAMATAVGMDKERRHFLAHHAIEHATERQVLPHEERRRAHHVFDPVTIGPGFDARTANGHDRAHRRSDRFGEAGAVLLVELRGHGAAGALGFRQRADADGAQLRQQRQKDFRGRLRIAQRGVATGDGDAEPGGETFKRITGETGRGDLGQQPRAKGTRRRPRHAGARELPPEHGKIKTDGVADNHGPLDRRGNFRCDRRERRRIGDRRIVNAVNAAGGRRNGFARLHPPMQRRRGIEPAAGDLQRAELDDPGPGRIEPRRFRIDDQGVKRNERGRVADGRHR